jgi:hypothetical protein
VNIQHPGENTSASMFTAGMFEQLGNGSSIAAPYEVGGALPPLCHGDDHQERRRHHRSVIHPARPACSGPFKAIRKRVVLWARRHAPAALSPAALLNGPVEGAQRSTAAGVSGAAAPAGRGTELDPQARVAVDRLFLASARPRHAAAPAGLARQHGRVPTQTIGLPAAVHTCGGDAAPAGGRKG